MTEYITGLQFLPWHILNVPFISFCCSVPLLISLMLEALILRKLKEMGIGVLAVRWQEQIGGKARGPGCESWDYVNARSHERNPGWSWASKSRLPTKYLNKKKHRQPRGMVANMGVVNRSHGQEPTETHDPYHVPFGFKKQKPTQTRLS